jgi:two-component system, sensor histidine kinase and response regulator
MSQPLILVVEDNPTQQTLIRLLGQRCGYTPQIVSSCEELLDVLTMTGLDSFDLVLMDWKLDSGPMDGIDCTRFLRQAETGSGMRIPIIGMTAYAMEGDREKCLEAGMDDYLSKPFTIDQLQRTLNKWLHKDNVLTFRPTVVREATR